MIGLGEPPYHPAAMHGFLVYSATRSHSRTGLNARSQSRKRGCGSGRFVTVALEDSGFPRMREDQGCGDSGA